MVFSGPGLSGLFNLSGQLLVIFSSCGHGLQSTLEVLLLTVGLGSGMITKTGVKLLPMQLLVMFNLLLPMLHAPPRCGLTNQTTFTIVTQTISSIHSPLFKTSTLPLLTCTQ